MAPMMPEYRAVRDPVSVSGAGGAAPRLAPNFKGVEVVLESSRQKHARSRKSPFGRRSGSAT